MEAVSVSVVIPVYNTKKYVGRCLQSVIRQTFTDFEVICIDDGSTDGSLEELRRYAQRDRRISVYGQCHAKAAAARNHGLRCAKGEYVLFIDSDDFIHKDMIRTLWRRARESDLDVVRCGFCIDASGMSRPDRRRERIRTDVMSGPAYFREVCRKGAYACHPCLGLVRRTFLLENEIYFREGMTHEDELWTPCMLLKAKKVQYVNRFFYHYVMREDSVMHSTDREKRGSDLLRAAQELARVGNIPPECMREWNDNILGKYFAGFTAMRGYRREQRALFSKTFPLTRVRSFKNLLRTITFICNYRLFYILNRWGGCYNRKRGAIKS